jgi:hypothetical protein
MFSYHIVFDMLILYYQRTRSGTYECDNRPAETKPVIYYTLHSLGMDREYSCCQGAVAEINSYPWEDKCLILVKYLEYVVQDGYDNTGLQAGVGHVVPFVWSHYGWPAQCQLMYVGFDG